MIAIAADAEQHGHPTKSTLRPVTALRMGVLGAANIARKVVIPAIIRADGVELVAIGSQSERGAEFVAEAGLTGVRACTYEQVLADPDVEAVYIALPNHLHAEWSMRAADAGK